MVSQFSHTKKQEIVDEKDLMRSIQDIQDFWKHRGIVSTTFATLKFLGGGGHRGESAEFALSPSPLSPFDMRTRGTDSTEYYSRWYRYKHNEPETTQYKCYGLIELLHSQCWLSCCSHWFVELQNSWACPCRQWNGALKRTVPVQSSHYTPNACSTHHHYTSQQDKIHTN